MLFDRVVGVFHRFDYEHRQRNRMKFTVRALGWDTFRARIEEALEEFRREGGAPYMLTGEDLRAEEAPDWAPPDAPSLQAVAAATPVVSLGIVPGTVRLQPLPDAYVRWMARNVSRQKQAGFCHVTARLPLGDFTAGQMGVLADLAEAYGDGTLRLTVEQNVLFRWVKTEAVEPSYQRLAAAGLGAPDAQTVSGPGPRHRSRDPRQPGG